MIKKPSKCTPESSEVSPEHIITMAMSLCENAGADITESQMAIFPLLCGFDEGRPS
jgi:hypothetical protein